MRGFFLLALVLGCTTGSSAYAQATEAAQPAAIAAPAQATAPQATTATVAPARNAPIALIVIRDARVPDNVATAMQTEGLEALRPLIRGRTLELIADATTFNACADNGCVGAELARAGKSGGVVVRMSRSRAQGPIEIRATAHDTVSGMQRGEPITASITGGDINRPANAVTTFVARLEPILWLAPPPAPMLLVAVNADGASVTIDGQVAGTTPLAPVVTTPGRHTASVSIAGYETATRMAEAGETGVTRIDIDLVPTPEMAERLASRQSTEMFAVDEGSDDSVSKPWYERWYVWAGAGAVVATAIIVGVVVATSDTTAAPPTGAIGIPPIQ